MVQEIRRAWVHPKVGGPKLGRVIIYENWVYVIDDQWTDHYWFPREEVISITTFEAEDTDDS